MRLQMRGQDNDWSEPLRRHAARRLNFALGRFSRSIGQVTIDIRRDTAAIEGLPKICRIAVNLLPEGRILVEDGQEDLYAAISRSAEQAGRAVGRALDRGRDWRAAPAPLKGRRDRRP